MHTFIINLKRSPERKAYMEKLMEDFPYSYEFFEAVDGREIKNLNEVYDAKKATLFYGKELKLGEIGCALSHLKIYKKMIDENIERALIFEDDIILDKDFLEVLASLKNKTLHNDIVLLGQIDEKCVKKICGEKITDNHKVHKVVNSGYGAHAYIIDKLAAEKIVSSNFPVKLPADAWAYFSQYVNVYVVEPNVASQLRYEGQSNIDNIEKRKEYVHISFKDELKKKLTIFNFVFIFCRKIFSFTKIIIQNLENFLLMILPTKRIE